MFQPYVAYATGSRPEAVAIGDLDGDGRNDVALLTSSNAGSPEPANDNMVHVFLQDTDGSLKPRVRYPAGGTGSSIDIGDVNGDGRADVVVGLGNAGGIVVLPQNGTGTLDPAVSYPAVNSYRIKVGDFNGDGRIDVAGISSGVDVLLQNEASALAVPVTYQVLQGGGAALDAGDIDGDGRTDLLVMGAPSNIIPDATLLLQTPDGVFGAPTSYSLPGNVNARGMALGDTNGDNRCDIVASYGGSPPNSFIARFLQNAQGTLDPAVSFSSRDNPSAMVLADMDGDGRKDALVTHPNTGWFGVYRQYPSGTFLEEEIYTVPTASQSQPQGLAVRDINGDGRPDVVIADNWHGLVVLREVADAQLALAITAPIGGSTQYVGLPLTVRWTVGDAVALAGFDLSVSLDNGTTYAPIAGCSGLPATATECTWTSPAQAFFGARIRATARDSSGQTASRETTVNLAAPSISLSGFSTTQYVSATTTISWFHNLPSTDTVRIELSRDGGGTYETLAATVPITTSGSMGSFAWTVTGPPTTTARLRITSNGSVPAGVTANFTIAALPTTPVLVQTTAGVAYTTSLVVFWQTNFLGASTVRVDLSRDGGATYQTIAAAASNLEGRFSGSVSGPGATDARVRITANGSVPGTGTSASFTLVQPTVTVSGPAAGSTLYTGTSTAITWSSNLPATSPVTVELSRDGGGTYAVVGTSATNTGSLAWTVAGSATSNARVRVTVGGPGSTAATGGTFAIVVPSLTVTGPAAGTSFFTGTSLAITWSTNLPAASPVTVELSRDGGSTYAVLAANAPNSGSFSWVAAGPSTSTAVARVTVGGPGSLSATGPTFAIVVPSLTVTSPAAGASFYAGTPLAIMWSSNLPAASPVTVELSRDGGGTFETLATAAPNTGNFDWIVTGPDTGMAIARVTVTDPVAVSGASGAFAITTPALMVTGPAAGTVAYAGTPVTITWADNLPASDPVSIELSRDGGATFAVLAAAVANTGSFVWTATGPDTAAARVRVTTHGSVSVGAVGPAFQIVTGSIAVTSPAAGANWAIGTARTIAWSSSNLPAGTTVLVELSRDGGTSWTTLSSASPASGSLAWTATGPATSSARVRVTANGAVPATATSGAFTIGNPALSVTSPTTGASWTIGVAQAITWTSNLLSTATVKIELSRNGGSTYTTLAASAPNTGSFTWTATGAATTTARVRVSANGFSASSTSGSFSLVAASVRVTAPNTAVTWTIGTVHAITWTHNLGASAPFKIEVSRSGVWSVIASAVTGGGATSGSFNWTVAGPRSTNAKIRVTWTGGTVTDSSDVSFTIN